MKTDEKALKRIVSRLEKAWQEDAAKAIERLYELLEGGKKVDVAVDQLRKEFPGLFTLPDVKTAMVEAAAYGYGIVPSMLTAAQLKSWEKALSESWNADGMKLSKRLHGTDIKMRNAIIDTIREQMKRNATWTASARALYDGYNADKVVRVQELPEYLKAVRRATQGSPEMLSAARKAVNNINRLAQKGAPTKALKTAYADMVKAATLGTQEQLQKAIWVAIQEKSRYVADRIIRTETARAWADGFFAKIMDDDDVVAVRWKLSTRHPVFDICDMYARADMYKLGAGIYPKDKLPPLPAHPHCLCGMVEMFVGEVDLTKQKNNIREAGNEWLKGLDDVKRRRVLGIVGEAQWSTGKDWRKFMNGWQGLGKPSSRLGAGLQEYRPVILSKEDYKGRYDSLAVTYNKVNSPQYDLYVSKEVSLKPKTLFEMENQINESRKLLGITKLDHFPKINILSNREIKGALGRYDAVSNELFFNSDILNVKKFKEESKGVSKKVSESRLMTVVHELIHWQDAEKYVAKYGKITNSNEYIRNISKSFEKNVDNLVAKGYNIGEISDYAERMYWRNRYDEVYTEYRTKLILEGKS